LERSTRRARAPGSGASRRVASVETRVGSRAYLRHDGLALLRVRLDGGAVAADGHLEVLGRVQERAELLLLLQEDILHDVAPLGVRTRGAGVERGRRATGELARDARGGEAKHRRLNASATSPEGARLSAGRARSVRGITEASESRQKITAL